MCALVIINIDTNVEIYAFYAFEFNYIRINSSVRMGWFFIGIDLQIHQIRILLN